MNMKFDALFFGGGTDKAPLARSLRVLCVSGAAALAFSMLGCAGSSSISESSNSISHSFNSSSKSSNSSSEERAEAYKSDVRHYAEAYARSNGDAAGFARGLSSVGEKHGVTNWEADNATYVGIGEGFAKAGVPKTGINVYMTYLAQGDPMKIAAIRKGFGQEP